MLRKSAFFVLFFLSSLAHAEVLYEDTTGNELNIAYDNIDLTAVKKKAANGECVSQYLMGMLYLSGDDELGVDPNYEKANDLLKKSWDAGVTDAGYSLAVIYIKGLGVAKDLNKAKDFLTKSAEAGYAKSQRDLGLAYQGEILKGVFKKDVEKSIHWLTKAALSGDQSAAIGLSLIYMNGEGADKSDDLAFKWRKKAAYARFANHYGAQFLVLGKMYEDGVGTSVDFVQAYKSYDLAGTAGTEGKQRVGKEMTQEQIDEALRQSQEWQKEHNVQVGGGFIRRAN